MARQTHTPIAAKGNYPSLPFTAASMDGTLLAADTTNFEQVAAAGKQLILAFNSGATAHTVTVSSIADPKTNRSGDISAYSIAAGKIMPIGPLEKEGWMQTDGNIYFQANHAEIKFCVVNLPQ